MSQLFDTTPASLTGRFAQVALERGIDAPEGLTYAIPDAMADVQVGERVVVPLGRGDRPVSGYVVALTGEGDYKHIKAIIARDSGAISLTKDLIALAQWMAGYYCSPIGMVFATMLPAAVKRGTGMIKRTMVSLADEAASRAEKIKLSKTQKTVLAMAGQLAAEGTAWTEIKSLADRAGARSVSPVKSLIEHGLLITRRDEKIFADWDEATRIEAAPAMSLTLNKAQSQAVDRLAESVERGFSVHLLHGVTGSGKTEVYLRAIERVTSDHAAGAEGPPPGVIVLVPEIALTPQTVSRFTGRFGGVAVLHSGLTASQRHEQWRRIRSGGASIVVGARSAIFAPLPRLGLIIVDEEHETSYKQDQLPRYHARDVAIRRAHLADVPVLLGSATPSLESYFNATGIGISTAPTPRAGWHLLELPERVTGLKLPIVELVDLGQERRKRYEMTGHGGVHLLSLRLELKLRSTLESKGQAMLLLNRRGYANYIACPDHKCGWMMACDHCDATMVYHKDAALPLGGVVRCHHCTAEQMLPQQCPKCSKKITVFGLGTQRVEEEIARKFPGARVLRMDSDVMRTGRDYYRSLEAFRKGEVDVLVGTQMIAKGLDFPNVRLVGVIAADTALHIPDFRASERTFQLVAQVAGRAGRGEHASIVIVQTFNPNDPAIQAASRHDFEGFAAEELALRSQMGLPPVARMTRIVVRDQDHAVCTAEARRLTDHLIASNEQLKLGIRIRGPMPCPIARIGDYHRQQVELIAPPPEPAATMQRLLTALRNERVVRSDAHMAVDVDPVSLL